MKLRYKISLGLTALLATCMTVFMLILGQTAPCTAAPSMDDSVESMNAVVARCYGTSNVLQFSKIAKPQAGDNSILAKVNTAAVNPKDWRDLSGAPTFMRLGSGLGTPKNQSVGIDFSGTVEIVGRDVSRFAPGDRIFGKARGTFGEYITVEDGISIAQIPDGVTFEQAAAIPLAGTTALHALRTGNLKAGQKVLINGASGGVGTYAVQIAKSMGAEVYGVCSTRNVDRVLALGADHVFDYKKENYTESGEQFDLVVDMIGNHSFLENAGILKPDGTMLYVGADPHSALDMFNGFMLSFLTSQFVSQEFLFVRSGQAGDVLNELGELMQSGEVASVIDRHYPLSETIDAVSYSATGRARGKILIDVE